MTSPNDLRKQAASLEAQAQAMEAEAQHIRRQQSRNAFWKGDVGGCVLGIFILIVGIAVYTWWVG